MTAAPTRHQSWTDPPGVAAGRRLLLLSARPDGAIAVAGEIDAWTGPIVERYVAATHGPLNLDLGAVAFMDSSGAEALDRIRRRCRADDRGFSILACSRPVEKVLRLLGWYEAFRLTA